MQNFSQLNLTLNFSLHHSYDGIVAGSVIKSMGIDYFIDISMYKSELHVVLSIKIVHITTYFNPDKFDVIKSLTICVRCVIDICIKSQVHALLPISVILFMKQNQPIKLFIFK